MSNRDKNIKRYTLRELGNLPMQGRSKFGEKSEQGCWARPGQGPGKKQGWGKVAPALHRYITKWPTLLMNSMRKVET